MLSFQNGIMSESHSGWLHKKTVGKWKPRFFNLSDGVMEMFASESMKMVLGSYRVRDGLGSRLPSDDGKLVFQVTQSGKSMEFAADSEADFEAWNAALTRVGVVWGDVSDDVRKPDEPSASAPSPVPISIETRAMATPEPVELAPTVSLEELIPKYSTLTTDGLNRVFDALDTNDEGYITVSQWCSAVRRKFGSKNLKLRTDLGLQLKLFQLLDDSGNGQVDREEFVSGIERIKSPELAEWLATALAQLDVSTSLVTPISRPATTEVKSAVPSWIKRSGTSKDLLETPTPRGEDVETKRSRYLRLFDVIDINGDGDVSVAELISSFRKHASSTVMSGDLDAQLKLFSAMDTDGSGGLDRDEFVTAALHIDDDMFTQWVDHVLYQDVLATEEERMAQIGAAADEKAKTIAKSGTKDFVMDASNPLFAAGTPTLSSPTTASQGAPSSDVSSAATLSKSQRAALVLGKASQASYKAKRGRGKK